MKKTSLKYLGPILAIGLGLTLGSLQAQSVSTTTREVTSEGTISSFEPRAFVVRSESTPAATYTYSTATRYVDDSGAEVTREVIRPGAPVTVYYTRDGDRMVASRVIVHRAGVAAPAPVAAPAETSTTRTTTTTVEQPPLTRHEAKEEARHERKREKEAVEHPERESRREGERVVVSPQPQVTETTTTETTSPQGVVRTFAPDQFVVNADGGPVTYRYSKSTEYVDEAGAPVTVDVVRSGVPVTVRYIREGDGLVARRVIVHRGLRPGPGPGPAVRRLPPP